MDLRKLILVNNDNYKVKRTIVPKGVMVHSTGANNPELRRYVNPDDGALGRNLYNNHWNQSRPDGQTKCVHAFIGKLANGKIATYQTLPFNHRAWHAGGSANDSYVSFEICEDGLSDKDYFNAVWKEATEFSAYICKEYKLNPLGTNVIIGHFEGHQLKIASNHADPQHWFRRHGKTMADFRNDVNKLMNTSTPPVVTPPVVTPPTSTPQIYRVRKTWQDVRSQIGAFSVLANAVRMAEANKGYSVFDNAGKVVYPIASLEIYTVQRGDTLWGISLAKLGIGTRWKEIYDLNNLKTATLQVGQRLTIPKR